MSIKIFLCPTVELAQAKAAELTEAGVRFATVEAEYGSVVVEGSPINDGPFTLTLAHHTGVWRVCSAPCNAKLEAKHLLSSGDAVIISHIDLDTTGGILNLIGSKPEHDSFWKAAEFVDLNGPHRLYELDESDADLIRAYWAATAENRTSFPRDQVSEVGQEISYLLGVVRDLLGVGNDWTQPDMIKRGKEWAIKQEEKVEGCLIEEGPYVRVFASDDTFTGAAYYSPKAKEVFPATVSYSTKNGSITIAFEDGGQSANASEIVQKLWGPTAGGHPGIAGSPRGQRMPLSALVQAKEATHHIMQGIDNYRKERAQ
jgi:hypothetical protein